MASPVAHTLLGISAGELYRISGWRAHLAVACWMILSANAADLDFVPGILVGDMNRWHHTASHSLLAVLVWALLSWVIAHRRAIAAGTFASVSALAYATHLVADWLTSDTRAPYGIPLFWPADRYFIAPEPVFGGIRHGVPGDSLGVALGHVFSIHNFIAMSREMLLVLPVFLLCWIIGRMRRGTRRL